MLQFHSNNTGSLVNNLFGVKFFNPFSFFTSSPFSAGMSIKSTNCSLSVNYSFSN